MRKLSLYVFIIFVAIFQSCNSESEPTVKCYAWLSDLNTADDATLQKKFKKYKSEGVFGLLYNGGQNPEIYKRLGKLAKDAGLEFHAWIPTMVQSDTSKLDTTWYAINGKGQSAWSHPAYVEYYKFLCPNREEVYNFLKNMYTKIAEVQELDGINLDYIRFPDVILAKGLWKKYNLVMDREFPQFDYCYCDKCVGDFKKKTGIDIKAVEDPAQVAEWKQFRYDLITNMVNRLAKDIRAKNKIVSAAVFPGPNSVAKKLVRQEWNKWNIDLFFPMNYNDFYLQDTKWIGKVCKEEVQTLNGSKSVYSGLFICPMPNRKDKEKDPENHGLLPEELGDAISQSMENGAAGICLFTPERMTDEHWKVFHKAVRKKYKTRMLN